MLFLSRGKTIKFHNLFEEDLQSIIKEYTARGFTGRLVIYLDNYTIELELQGGRIVAAMAEDKASGNIVKGEEAIKLLREKLGERNGYVEVIELNDEKIRVDLEYAPSARVPGLSVEQLFGEKPGPQAIEASQTTRTPSEETRAGFSHEALSLARDVAALLRIVLRAEKSIEISSDRLSKVVAALSESRGPYSIAYARCITRHNRVINVVCTSNGCAAADVNGNYVEELEEPMTCKIYFAS